MFNYLSFEMKNKRIVCLKLHFSNSPILISLLCLFFKTTQFINICKQTVLLLWFIKLHRCIWMLCVWRLDCTFGNCQPCNNAKTIDWLILFMYLVTRWCVHSVILPLSSNAIFAPYAVPNPVSSMGLLWPWLQQLFKHDDFLHAKFWGGEDKMLL